MKIGILSDIITFSTGYGQVAKNLLLNLKNHGHEVVNFALQYQGFPIEVAGIKIYSALEPETMHRAFMAAKCDYIIHLRDNWVYTPFNMAGMYHIINVAHEAGSKLVNYTPLQNYPVPEALKKSFKEDGDFTLTMSRWSLDYIRSLGNSNSDYLYHGVDPAFRPMKIDKRPLNMPDGTMLMHTGYSIDYRKMTPLVLLTLKKYLPHDESAFLYMHTQPRGFYANDVISASLELPPDKVKLPSVPAFTNALPVNTYNMLLNSASAYLNLSASEGFGLTELEAASIGIPTLVTDFPIHRELLSQFPNVGFVKSRKEMPTVWGFEWFADTDDAVEKLIKLKEKGFARSEAMIPPEYNWENVTFRLEKILEGI